MKSFIPKMRAAAELHRRQPKLRAWLSPRPKAPRQGAPFSAFATANQLLWNSLFASYLLLIVLVVVRQILGPLVPGPIDKRWFVDPQTRFWTGSFAAVAAGSQCLSVLLASAYSSGPKRSPVLATSAYCLLACLTFSLDAHGLLYRPFELEICLLGLFITSSVLQYAMLGSLIAMQYNQAEASRFLSDPKVYAVPLWQALWPVPRVILKLWASPGAIPLAVCMDVIILVVFARLGLRSHQRTGEMLQTHPAVFAVGGAMFLLWVTAELVHLAIAAEAPGLPAAAGLGILQLYVLGQMVHVCFYVSQAIVSYEESSRFKAERDAVQAELAVRIQQQQQAKDAEEARQKFLRYVFHEIRVPFNSLDMGLGMLLEDVATADQARSSSQGTQWATGQAQPVVISEDARAVLDIMAKAADSMKVIINDSMDWSKLQSGAFHMRFEAVQLQQVVGDTMLGLDLWAAHPDNKVKLEYEAHPDLPAWVLADKVRLQQVVANFLSNAINFAPKDGTGVVTVRVHLLASPGSAHEEHPFPSFDSRDVWWKEVSRPSGSATQFSTPSSQHMFASGLPLISSPVPDQATLMKLQLAGFEPLAEDGAAELQRAPTQQRTPPSTGSNGSPGYCTQPHGEEALVTPEEEASIQHATIVISVKDNGAGIDTHAMPALFKAFRQLDAGMQNTGKGTGLGLAISHEIVSLHGGRLGVRSSGEAGQGSGSEFIIALRLPVLRSIAPTGEPGVGGSSAKGSPTVSTRGRTFSAMKGQGTHSAASPLNITVARAPVRSGRGLSVLGGQTGKESSPASPSPSASASANPYYSVATGEQGSLYAPSSATLVTQSYSSADVLGAAVPLETYGTSLSPRSRFVPFSDPSAGQPVKSPQPKYRSVESLPVLSPATSNDASAVGMSSPSAALRHPVSLRDINVRGPSSSPLDASTTASVGRTSVSSSVSSTASGPAAAGVGGRAARAGAAPSAYRMALPPLPLPAAAVGPRGGLEGGSSIVGAQPASARQAVLPTSTFSSPAMHATADPATGRTLADMPHAIVLDMPPLHSAPAGPGAGPELRHLPGFLHTVMSDQEEPGHATLEEGSANEPSAVVSPASSGADVPTCVFRLLIVDDVSDNRRLLRKALVRKLQALYEPSVGRVKFEVDEAENGEVAVSLVARAGQRPYHLITMDAEMPVLSGFMATQRIRGLGYKGVVLGCTGNALEEDQQLFLQCGANDIFIKPLDIQAIAQTVLKSVRL